MNILIAAADSKPNTGGIAELTHQLARHLKFHGHQVGMISPAHPEATEFDGGVEYSVKRLNPSWRGRRKISALYVAWTMLCTSVNQSAEIILANSLWSWPQICHYVARMRRIPFGVLVHGNDLKLLEGKKGGRYLKALSAADIVVCNSSSTAARASHFGIDSYKLHTINPGIAVKQFDRCNPKLMRERLGIGDRPMLLTVGRLVERKGHDVVIRAMRRIQENIGDVVYVVAGTGPAEGNLRDLATALGIPVLFCGYVSDQDLVDYYHACDVFIMPAREIGDHDVEGFGIVYMEANACGKPVIAGRSGGVEEAVLDGVTGLLVDPLDETQVADAAVRLLMDPGYAHCLGSNGQKRAKEQFDWVNIAQRHARLLQSTVDLF